MKKLKNKVKVLPKHNLFKQVLAAFVLVLAVLLMKLVPSQRAEPIKTDGQKSTNVSVDTIEISGVKVNDFFKTAPEVNSNGYTAVSLNPKHQILYFPDDELFLISIIGYPFDDYIGAAEKDFLEKLGIKEGEACKLNVSITTPVHRNPDKAGEVYRLSWCE